VIVSRDVGSNYGSAIAFYALWNYLKGERLNVSICSAPEFSNAFRYYYVSRSILDLYLALIWAFCIYCYGNSSNWLATDLQLLVN
jgi:hypothetical protein